MDETARNILAGLPHEKVTSPSVGDYDNARFVEARLVENTRAGTYAAELVFRLPHAGGQELEHVERVNIPQTDSEHFIKHIAKRALVALGVMGQDDDVYVLDANSAQREEQGEAWVSAVNTRAGSVLPVRIEDDKDGFPRLRFRRARRQ